MNSRDNSNFHDSMAMLVACLSPLIYLSQQYHDLQAQPQQFLSCDFSRLLLALRKDLDSANDHYSLCLY